MIEGLLGKFEIPGKQNIMYIYVNETEKILNVYVSVPCIMAYNPYHCVPYCKHIIDCREL